MSMGIRIDFPKSLYIILFDEFMYSGMDAISQCRSVGISQHLAYLFDSHRPMFVYAPMNVINVRHCLSSVCGSHCDSNRA